MSGQSAKHGNQAQPYWDSRAQERGAEDSARRFPAGDDSCGNHSYYFTAFPLTSGKFSPLFTARGKCHCRLAEIFWQSARLTIAGLVKGKPAAVNSGESLVKEMHGRYAASWYPTVTFTQKSTTYNPDGTTKVETWYEAALLPGKLRIDIGPPSEGNGYLLVDGNVTVFKEGQVKANVPQVNMLLVLGFDVYKQTSEATLAIAKKEGFDAGKFHEDTWEGKPVYVFGAEKGDLKSKQFWVEKDRMLFVRLLEPDRSDPNKTQDIRFADYRKLGGGWIAALVEVYLDGKKVFSEEYTEINGDVRLDPAVFDPKQFTSAHWEKP